MRLQLCHVVCTVAEHKRTVRGGGVEVATAPEKGLGDGDSSRIAALRGGAIMMS